MRDLALDFQPRRPGLLPLILLLVGAVLCADAWLEASQQNAQLADLESRQEQAKRRADRLTRASREAAQREAALPAEQGKALQQAVGAIRIDWEALYRHIDQATQEEVSLLAITPNVAAKSLQISGEARNLQAALGFVESLRRPPLSQVNLLSHKIKADDPQRPVSFEIAATWTSSP
jgi:Tfp pilus assembly protein PilN